MSAFGVGGCGAGGRKGRKDGGRDAGRDAALPPP